LEKSLSILRGEQMTPTQIQIRNMSDKDLVWRKKVIDSHVERLLKQQEWLTEEMERRSKL